MPSSRFNARRNSGKSIKNSSKIDQKSTKIGPKSVLEALLGHCIVLHNSIFVLYNLICYTCLRQWYMTAFILFAVQEFGPQNAFVVLLSYAIGQKNNDIWQHVNCKPLNMQFDEPSFTEHIGSCSGTVRRNREPRCFRHRSIAASDPWWQGRGSWCRGRFSYRTYKLISNCLLRSPNLWSNIV